MSALLDDVGKVLCEQGENLECLHPKTIKYIELCDETARVNYHRSNPEYSRQVKAMVVASARTFDLIVKELDQIKSEVHSIRDSTRKEPENGTERTND